MASEEPSWPQRGSRPSGDVAVAGVGLVRAGRGDWAGRLRVDSGHTASSEAPEMKRLMEPGNPRGRPVGVMDSSKRYARPRGPAHRPDWSQD